MTSLPAVELLGSDVLARGLITGDARLAGLLTHAPQDEGALQAAAHVAAARPLARDALAAAILDGLRELEAPPPALAAAAGLRRPGTVVVVSGQQPGLLGGSLMVLVKALAAAAVARSLTAAGVPAVAVFWHASEDHDHREADHVGWLRGGAPEWLRVTLPDDGRMLSRVPVPPPAREVVADVLSALVPGPGLAVLADVLPPRAGESFGLWSGRILARVLGAQGVVVVEPRTLRRLGAATVRHDLAHPGALRSAIAEAEATVARAGYAPPLTLVRDALHFAVDGDGRRTPPRDGEPRRADGEWFSWNVASRVLAQDLVLPVAAQICGPSELGYVSLLRGAHERLGVPQPAALLRPGVTIVPPAVRRACRGLDIETGDVVRRGAGALPPVVHGSSPALVALERAIEALPAGRSPASARRLRALRREAALFAEALDREAQEADVVRARRRATILAELCPFGRPQERVLSFLPWFAAGGDAAIGRLLDLLGAGDPLHHIVAMEDLR